MKQKNVLTKILSGILIAAMLMQNTGGISLVQSKENVAEQELENGTSTENETEDKIEVEDTEIDGSSNNSDVTKSDESESESEQKKNEEGNLIETEITNETETETSIESEDKTETDTEIESEEVTENVKSVRRSTSSSKVITGTCGDNVKWTLQGGTLTLSGKGAMTEYSSYVNVPWYSYRDSINKLVISDGITSISSYAFYGCDSLSGNLTIPESVTSIGKSAFRACRNLTGDLIIPDSVTSIGDYAFELCVGFTGKLKISDKMTEIRPYTFSYCYGLTGELAIPESVTSIGAGAFNLCRKFTGNLEIPNSVTNIGTAAFMGCLGFNGYLVIPNNISFIGDKVFSGCKNLKGTLTIPNSVIVIGIEAFKDCSGFDGNLSIPNSVIYIDNGAFSGCSGFTGDLVIPNRLTSISDYAFSGCTGFETLTIPSSVKSIGIEAFNSCSGFTGTLTIPNSVKSIGDRAFAYCSGFTGDLKIPDSVTSVGVRAFSYCYGFTGNLILSNNLDGIEYETFLYCYGFTGNLNISNNIASIGYGAFRGCYGFGGNLTIPDSVTEIGNYAFSGCSGLNGKVSIPSTVTKIGTDSFKDISNLTIYGVKGSYAETYANDNSITFVEYTDNNYKDDFESDTTVDALIISEVTKYTLDEVYAQYDAIMNSGLGSDEKLRLLNELSHNNGITDVKEGIKYLSQISSNRRNYLYLTTDENYCAYNWWYWLNTTTKGKVARGLLYADGLIFNYELSTYLDWSTYANNSYPGVEKCKTMLKDFMETEESDSLISESASYSKKVSKWIKNLVKYNDIIVDEELETICNNIEAAFNANNAAAIEKYQTQLANLIIRQAKIYQEIEENGEVTLYLGADAISEVMGYAAPIITVTSATVEDVIDIMNLETNIEKYKEYEYFLTEIYNNNDVSKEMRIAAYQLLDDIENGYYNEIKSILSNFITFGTDILFLDKSLLKSYLESKGLSTVASDLIGGAIKDLTIATVISNLICDTGDFVKQAAYTMSYAEIASMFSMKLQEDKAAFEKNPTADNAWKFYEDYNLLLKLRYKGEEQYLNMNTVKVFVFKSINTYGYSYKEEVVKDVLSILDQCDFELDDRIEVPTSVQYLKKSVVECPVDVLVYTKDGTLIAEMKDGKLSDVTNEYGRFAVVYESYSGEYAKVICQTTNDDLVIKLVSVDNGIVDFKSAEKDSDKILAFSNIPIELGDKIEINNDEYTIVSNKTDVENKTISMDVLSEGYVNVQSVSLSEKTAKMLIDEEKVVSLSVLPNNATYKNVIWYSEDEDIATVRNGVIKAKSKGDTVIWAKSCDNEEFTDSIAITVIGSQNNNDLDKKPSIGDTSNSVTQQEDSSNTSSVDDSDSSDSQNNNDNGSNNNTSSQNNNIVEDVLYGAVDSEYVIKLVNLTNSHILNAALIDRFYGQRVYISAIMQSNFGIIINMENVFAMNKDLDASYNISALTEFAPEFNTFYAKANKLSYIGFDVILNFNVGEAYIGKKVYVYMLNDAKTGYDLIGITDVNIIGNVAFSSDKITDFIFLVEK